MNRLQEWALRLNRRQTRALVSGILACLFFAMRPYWYFIVKNEVGGTKYVPGEFAFVSTPPTYYSEFVHSEAHIHWAIFAIVELLCIGLTVVAVAILRDKNNEASATFGQYR